MNLVKSPEFNSTYCFGYIFNLLNLFICFVKKKNPDPLTYLVTMTGKNFKNHFFPDNARIFYLNITLDEETPEGFGDLLFLLFASGVMNGAHAQSPARSVLCHFKRIHCSSLHSSLHHTGTVRWSDRHCVLVVILSPFLRR